MGWCVALWAMGVQVGDAERVAVGLDGGAEGGAGAPGNGRALSDVCRALGRRRAALYGEEEIARAAGLSVERLRAVEAGEAGVTVGEADALAAALAVMVPLPKRGRLPRARVAGWWLTEEERR